MPLLQGKSKTEQKNGNSKRWKNSKNQTAKQQKESKVDRYFRQEECDVKQEEKNRCYHQREKSRKSQGAGESREEKICLQGDDKE